MPVAALPVHRREPCLGTSGAELSPAHKAKLYNRNLLPWHLVETQQSCPGRKSAKTLQVLPFLQMGASGFVSCFTPGSNCSSLGLLTRRVLAHHSSRRKAVINPISCTSLYLRKLHVTTDEVQPHLTCNTGVQSRFRKLCQRPSLEP